MTGSRPGLARPAALLALRLALGLFLAGWLAIRAVGLPAPQVLGTPSIGGAQPGPGWSSIGAAHVPGEVLVKFRPHASARDRDEVRGLFRASVKRTFRHGGELLQLGPGQSFSGVLQRLRRHPLIEYAEPNYVIRAEAVPDDPRFSEQDSLRNFGQRGSPGSDISVVAAWDLTTGSRDVVVAITDTGVDLLHPDLIDNLWANPGEIPGNGIDDDQNGYIDDQRGWDFVSSDSVPADGNGHGTHVAGIVGATGNNGVGITGVNWKVSLMAVRFLGSNGSGTTADAVASIEYATANGAHVINASWGSDEFSQSLYDAVAAARDAGVLLVAAAGNKGVSTDNAPHYPASFPLSNVIAVLATDPSDFRALFSSYGKVSVHLGAPGLEILSTLPDSLGAYGRASGTSMAAPHVSGAAALILSAMPGLTVDALKGLILDSVDPVPALANVSITGGRLNVNRPFSEPDETPPGAIGDLAVLHTASNDITLGWTATGDDGSEGTASSYDLRVSPVPLDALTFAGAPAFQVPGRPLPTGSPESVTVRGLAAGTTYHLALRARDEWGNSGPISNVVVTDTLPPPTLATDPGELSLTAPQGLVADVALTVQNAGSGTLDWSIPPPFVSRPEAPGEFLPVTISPAAGRLNAGEATSAVVRVDLTASLPGAFAGDVLVLSNDPGAPMAAHPMTVTVQPAPLASVSPQTLDFGHVFTGSSAALSVEITNAGTLPLHVTGTEIEAAGLTALPATLEIPPGSSASMDIRFAPVSAGVLSGEVRILTTAPATPVLAVTVSGTSGLPPQVRADPGAMAVDLPTGGHAELLLRIENTGETVLHIDPGYTPTAGLVPLPQWAGLAKGEEAAPPGGSAPRPVQDLFGYTALNSNSEGGPVFSWVEADRLGSPLSITGDDEISEPVGLGFLFPFYGQVYDSVRICSNGWLSFTSSLSSFNNPGHLPAGGEDVPETLVAPFFDDLDLKGDQRVFVHGDAASFVVQYSHVSRYGSEADLTFQVVLKPDGRIVFQYLTLAGDLGTPTVGIQDATRNGGLLVTSQAGELTDQMAVELAPPPVFQNGSFETGGFTGWVVRTSGSTSRPWEVRTKGNGFFRNSQPVEGQFNILNGFDGQAGLVYELYQDITIPLRMVRAELSYYDRIQFNDFSPPLQPMTLPKIYEATVQDMSGNILEVLAREEIFPEGKPFTDLGLQRRSADLLPYAGQKVRVHLRQFAPESFRGVVSMEYDAFKVEVEPEPSWLLFSREPLVIPPGGSRDLTIGIHAGLGGDQLLQSGIRLATNDPDQPTLDVPVDLNVAGGPHIGVPDDPIIVESVIPLPSSSVRQSSHLLDGLAPPVGGIEMEFFLEGDYRFASQFTTAIVDDLLLGDLAGPPSSPGICPGITRVFPLNPLLASQLTFDNALRVDLTNSLGVSNCTTRHTVRLRYRPARNEVSVGELYTGQSIEIPLDIANLGTDTLSISSITTTPGPFSVLEPPASIPPGGMASARLVFSSAEPGSFQSDLSIQSNDPDQPTVTLPLSGQATPPPVASVHPSSLTGSLSAGGHETRDLAVFNNGGSPLAFSLTVTPGQTGFVRVQPTSGTVVAGGSATVQITLDALGLTAGTQQAELVVSSNDPSRPEIHVPVALVVTGAPDISLGDRTITLQSTRSYLSTGGITEHEIPVLVPPAARASIELQVRGQFTQPGASAALDLEGIPIGVLSGSGSCQTATDTFSVPAALMAGRGSDGLLSFRVENLNITPCFNYGHGIVVNYLQALEMVDFGAVFVGYPESRTFVIENLGTDQLEIPSMQSSRPDVSISPEAASLAPGQWVMISATFDPPGDGALDGAIEISSNDPDEPTLTVPLHGRGVLPPQVGVDPGQVDVTLPRGQQLSGTVAVINSGPGPLEYVTSVAPGGSAFFQVQEAGGTLAPDSTTQVPFLITTASLNPGLHQTVLEILSNDPALPVLSIPVSVAVDGVPLLRVHGQQVTMTSSQFLGFGVSQTSHKFPIVVPPAGQASLDVRVAGPFSAPDRYALVSSEGIVLGVASEGGASCSYGSVLTIPIEPDRLATLMADGIIYMEMQNSPAVGPVGCAGHRLDLRYEGRTDRLDFGSIFVETGRTLSLDLENAGSATLEILASTDAPGVTLDAPALSISPGDTRRLKLEFRPALAGLMSGALTLLTNDPTLASLTIPLAGEGRPQPRGSVAPAALTETLPVGGVKTVPLTLTNDGGSPLEFDITAFPSFVSVKPFLGTLPPGGSVSLEVRLDASALLGGEHLASLSIATNSPATPTLTVPVALTVVGVPAVILDGGAASATSTQTWSVPSARTLHSFEIAGPPAAGIRVQVTVRGDFLGAGKLATVSAEGLLLGTVGPASQNCGQVIGVFSLPPQQAASLVADGRLEVEVLNSAAVSAGCSTRQHQVQITYGAPIDLLDLGSLFTGLSTTGTFRVINAGTDQLVVQQITVSHEAFQAAPDTFSLSPGASRTVTVTFASGDTGVQNGVISVASNAPDTPVVTLPVTGEGLPAPEISASPASLSSNLYSQGQETLSLTLANTGGSPLSLFMPSPAVSWLSWPAQEAALAPGESLQVSIQVNAQGLPPGTYTGEVQVSSNSPQTPSLSLPVTLNVAAAPHLHLQGATVTLESTQDFSVPGAVTRHPLLVDIPPAAGGVFTLTAQGRFYTFGSRWPELWVEGTRLGQGFSGTSACSSISSQFPVTAEMLAGFAADGLVDALVQNTIGVTADCPTNRHGVALAYEASAAILPFGRVPLGGSRTLEILVKNTGAAALSVTSVTSSLADVAVAPSSAEIAPGGTVPVQVTFLPSGQEPQNGVLTMASSDPDAPQVQVPITAQGYLAGALEVSPPSLVVVMPFGASETHELLLINSGDGEVRFNFDDLPEDSFVTVDPASGSVPPNGSLTIQLLIHSRFHKEGRPRRFLRLRTDDPEAALLSVPVTLEVQDAPNILVSRRSVLLTSHKSYGPGVLGTSHSLTVDEPPPAGGMFNLIINGDYGQSDETATFIAENRLFLGELGRLGTDCIRAETEVYVGPTEMARLVEDGTVDVTAQASQGVQWFCGENWHRVFLRYQIPLDTLDLGAVPLATATTAVVALENNGTLPLTVSSIQGEGGPISPGVTSASLLPNQVMNLEVTVEPVTAGRLDGFLHFASDDPDTPLLSVPVTAMAAGPPRLSVAPATLPVEILQGQQVTRVLSLANEGSLPLTYSLELQAPGGFASISTQPGTLAQGETTEIQVQFGRPDLAPGDYTGTIEVATNDPESPLVSIPISLRLVPAPRLVLAVSSQVESEKTFTTAGAQTVHELPVTDLAPLPGVIRVTVDGDYGASTRTAAVSVDGLVLGTLGGLSGVCPSATMAFPLASNTLADLAADGLLVITISNSPDVSAGCPSRIHRATLEYSREPDSLAFPDQFTGLDHVRELAVHNAGGELLLAGPIQAEGAGWSVTPGDLSVAPGGSAPVFVRFSPTGPGGHQGTLHLASNDTARASVQLPLTGQGVDPPVLRVEPEAIAVSIRERGQARESLTVSNAGGTPLDVALEVVPLTGPGTPSLETGALEAATASQPALQRLPDSPVPLTGLVADPVRGHVYGQQRAGQAFYRYARSTGTWEQLTSAPRPAYFEAGGALHKGKIYMSYPSDPILPSLGVFDLATGTWSTIPNPILGGTAVIASDGNALYMGYGLEFLRFDPDTLRVTLLPAPPISIYSQGGMSHLEGLLYVQTGAFSGSFLAFDTSTRRWEVLPAPPSRPLTGAAIDPVRRHVFTYGNFPTPGIYRYSVESATWEILPPPSAGLDHGGLAWLPAPFSGVYMADGATGFHRLPAGEAGLQLTVPDATIPPSGSMEFALDVNTVDLPAGTFQGSVKIASTDPFRPVADVPITIEVEPVPEIAVGGTRISMRSHQAFSSRQNWTSHSLPLDPPPLGDLIIRTRITGDFGDSSEFAEVLLDGKVVGSVGGQVDCQEVTRDILIHGTLAEAIRQAGQMEVEVRNSTLVDPFCVENSHDLEVIYTTPTVTIDAGEIFVGGQRTVSLVLENRGLAPLEIASVAATAPGVTAVPAAAVIPARSERSVAVTFQPGQPGALQGNLVIESNDPAAPQLALPLSGQALAPPLAEIQPAQVIAALPPRSQRQRIKTVTLANGGLSSLQWSADVRTLPQVMPSASAAGTWEELPKGDDSDLGQGTIVPSQAGGPDALGYRFRDSREPDGPRFRWEDIRETGQALWLAGDDQNSGPVALGFPFPFYGETFEAVNICSNGWLSFSSLRTSYSNPATLPSAGQTIPGHLIAPFWDDLDLRGERRIHVLQGPDTFTVQFSSMDRFVAPADLTFQVILHRDGRVRFQYLSMAGDLRSATIGIQDGTRSAGLLVAYNRAYIEDGLAVEFLPPIPWVELATSSGLILPGESASLGMRFTSLDLDPGEFQAALLVRSDDPTRPELEVPIHLRVDEVPLMALRVEPETVNLSSLGSTIRASLQLTPDLDPRQVRLDSLRLQDTLPALSSPTEITDEDGDGIEELIVKFNRQGFIALLPDADQVELELTGEVEDVTWFRGSDSIQAIRPRLGFPNGGQRLAVGQPVEITWTPPPLAPAASHSLELSRDGGDTWEELAGPRAGTTFTWEVTGPASETVRMRVLAWGAKGLIGYDTSDGNLAVSEPALPPNPVTGLALGPAGSGVACSWNPPVQDSLHHPATAYRIVQSVAPRGPFAEVGTSPIPSFQLPDAAPEPGTAHFIKIIAVNEGGESPDD